jgi:hypothetical protein
VTERASTVRRCSLEDRETSLAVAEIPRLRDLSAVTSFSHCLTKRGHIVQAFKAFERIFRTTVLDAVPRRRSYGF